MAAGRGPPTGRIPMPHRDCGLWILIWHLECEAELASPGKAVKAAMAVDSPGMVVRGGRQDQAELDVCGWAEWRLRVRQRRPHTACTP